MVFVPQQAGIELIGVGHIAGPGEVCGNGGHGWGGACWGWRGERGVNRRHSCRHAVLCHLVHQRVFSGDIRSDMSDVSLLSTV